MENLLQGGETLGADVIWLHYQAILPFFKSWGIEQMAKDNVLPWGHHWLSVGTTGCQYCPLKLDINLLYKYTKEQFIQQWSCGENKAQSYGDSNSLV